MVHGLCSIGDNSPDPFLCFGRKRGINMRMLCHTGDKTTLPFEFPAEAANSEVAPQPDTFQPRKVAFLFFRDQVGGFFTGGMQWVHQVLF